MEIACTQCGQTFRVKRYIAARPGNHFCGQTCYGLHQRAHPRARESARLTVSCAACGSPITREPSALVNRARVFCDRACFWKWRRKHPPTPIGRPPKRTPWPPDYHLHYRGKNWPEQRRLARERDGYTCQHCGEQGRSLPVHHKTPFRLFADYIEANQLPNLVTLCKACHNRADAAYRAAHPELGPVLMRFPTPTPCARCGALFPPRNNKHRICDACRQVRCGWCGTTFENTKPAGRNARYCSVACDHAHRRAYGAIHANRTCEACGAPFTSKHWSVRHCSVQCLMRNSNPRRAFFARRRLAAQASGQSGAAP